MPALVEKPERDQMSLQADLIRSVEKRTWGQIHQLHVEVGPKRVALHGWARSYYAKQLAVAAAREVLGDDSEVAFDLRIDVLNAMPRASEGEDNTLSDS